MHYHASYAGLWSPDGASEHSVPFWLIDPIHTISWPFYINTSIIDCILVQIRSGFDG